MKTLFVLIALSLVACTPETSAERTQRLEHEAYGLKHMSYYHDTRTDQCFAAYAVGYNSGFVTTVACTGPVLDGAIEFKSNK